jgi:hypothetical protein
VAQAPVFGSGFEVRSSLGGLESDRSTAVALEERYLLGENGPIKKDAKVFVLELAVRMMDLTTLEGLSNQSTVRPSFRLLRRGGRI